MKTNKKDAYSVLNLKGSVVNENEKNQNKNDNSSNLNKPNSTNTPANPNSNQNNKGNNNNQNNNNQNNNNQGNNNQQTPPPVTPLNGKGNSNPNQNPNTQQNPNPNPQNNRPAPPPPLSQTTSAKKKRGLGFWIWMFVFLFLIALMFTAIFSAPSDYISQADMLILINSTPSTDFMAYWYYDWYIVVQYQVNGVIYITTFDDMATFSAFTENVVRAPGYALDFGVQPYTGPGFFATLFFSLLPWVLIIVITFMLIRKASERQAGAGKMKSAIMLPKISNVRLANIAGYDEVKQELIEIIDFLKNPIKYQNVGARTPKGILLSGPPGTGKTLFAKAVAGEASIPFYSISGSDFVELFVGVGASRVRSLFEQAKKTAPSLIFIDELDAVGRMRGAGIGGGNDEREQTLNQLLVELDGFEQNSGIVVMAATNRPDVLDSALKRPGRFDRSIELRLPDIREREWILKSYAKLGGKNISNDIDWKNIAGRTPGFSGAELENVINEAAILSVRMNSNLITLDIVDEAIDRVIGGPSKVNNMMSKDEKNLIAHHESGHAIIGLVLPDAEQVQKISIIPRGQAGGYVLMTPKKEKFVQTKEELLSKVISYMGGRASEEIFFGSKNVTTGAHNDIQEATKIARRMVTEFGMSDLGPIQYEKPSGSAFLGRDLTTEKSFSSRIQFEIDVEIRKIIDHCYKEALKIIRGHKTLVKLFSKALMIKETLNMEEAAYIYKTKKLPKKVLDYEKAQKKPSKNTGSNNESTPVNTPNSTSENKTKQPKTQPKAQPKVTKDLKDKTT